VSCFAAVVAFPTIQFRAGGANLIVAVRPARTRAPGARAQPGPDKIAPGGRKFASYPLLVLFIYYKISFFCKSTSIVYPSKSTRMNFSALAK
jgi:hypothetical protein